MTEKDLQVKDAWLKYLHHATEAQKLLKFQNPLNQQNELSENLKKPMFDD